MDDFEARLNILDIGNYILYGGTITEEFKNNGEKDLIVICNTAYDEAEKAIKKILKDYETNNNKIIENIMKELNNYGSTSEITGFCEGLKAGVKLFIELAVK